MRPGKSFFKTVARKVDFSRFLKTEADLAGTEIINHKMRTFLKVMVVSWMIFLATASLANEVFAEDTKNPKLKTGTSIDLSTQDVVWHKGSDYVIASGTHNYLVKTDDDGNAIVVDRVNNLTDFVQSNGAVYVARPITGVYAGPIYNPWFYTPPVIVPYHPRPYRHVVVVHPRRVRI
jgi:hypothetical protein